MATCKLYKGSTLLGAGSITSGSASVTSWVVTSGYVLPAVARRNVQVAITSSTNSGATFVTRVLSDNGSGTLTLEDTSPFAT